MHRLATPPSSWKTPRTGLLRLSVALLLTTLACASLLWTPAVAVRADSANEAALTLDTQLINEAKSGTELMANLSYLSDIIGPRLTGSAALKRANEWTAEKMKSYGLTDVRLEPWTIPVGWERGTAYARVVEPANGRTLLFASKGWAPSTKGKVVCDVVVMNARSQQDLAKYKGKLKNAVILSGPPANVRPITEVARQQPGLNEPAKGRPGQPGKPRTFDRGRFGASLAFRRA